MRSSEPADPSEARFEAGSCGLGHEREALRAAAGIDPRVYRRLHILLKREGWEVNWKKLYRL